MADFEGIALDHLQVLAEQVGCASRPLNSST